MTRRGRNGRRGNALTNNTRPLLPRRGNGRFRGTLVQAPMAPRAMLSIRTNGAMDPEPVEYTIRVQHRVQFSLPLTAGVATQSLTPERLEDRTPGTGAWDRIRLIKIDAWGPTAGHVQIDMTGGSGSAETEASRFVDWGTPGSRRAVLHVVPAFSLRNSWFSTSLSSSLADVSFSGPATGDDLECVINCTVEVATAPLALLSLRPPQGGDHLLPEQVVPSTTLPSLMGRLGLHTK